MEGASPRWLCFSASGAFPDTTPEFGGVPWAELRLGEFGVVPRCRDRTSDNKPQLQQTRHSLPKTPCPTTSTSPRQQAACRHCLHGSAPETSRFGLTPTATPSALSPNLLTAVSTTRMLRRGDTTRASARGSATRSAGSCRPCRRTQCRVTRAGAPGNGPGLIISQALTALPVSRSVHVASTSAHGARRDQPATHAAAITCPRVVY